MRLWHQDLIPYLDRQRLLAQHRECCALRGKGWGKKHATVDYVFKYPKIRLVQYHYLVMNEMKKRGYNVDALWTDPRYCGKNMASDPSIMRDFDISFWWQYFAEDEEAGRLVYDEHNTGYLRECIQLLKNKQAPIDFEKVERNLHLL